MSRGFLLDTNCISELVRIRPEPRVVKWIQEADEQSLYLCVLTLGEIRKGIVHLPEGKRRSQLETWLDFDLKERFARRILTVNEAVADRWGILAGEMKRNGTLVPTVDAIPAATALHHGLTVVSRNLIDFQYRKTSAEGRRAISIRSQAGALRFPGATVPPTSRNRVRVQGQTS